jgi:hypothetical protein
MLRFKRLCVKRACPLLGAMALGLALCSCGDSVPALGNAAYVKGSAEASLFSMLKPVYRYTVTYNGSRNASGSVPVDRRTYLPGQEATVMSAAGGLAKRGYSFAAWNSRASGLGVTYGAGATFRMASANAILYPILMPEGLEYEVSGSSIAVTGCSPVLAGALVIPGGVTSIGDEAFAHSSLASVSIPASVTSVGMSAFGGSSRLTGVTLNALVPPLLSAASKAFASCDASFTIRVPASGLAAYKAAAGWREYAAITFGY